VAEASLLLDPRVLTPSDSAAEQARTRALVEAHFDFVWRLLCRLGVPAADVDDAAQQVFIVAAQRLGSIAPERERTFLYGTALRTAGTLRRSQRRRRRWFETTLVEAPSAEPTPEEHVERREALAFLDAVLSQLPDELREVFVLCEVEELSAPEVATITGVAVGTVASRLRRARQKFDQQARRLQAQRGKGS
jgi:RNA polymerase sigma-70 factor (ECF subfamily)